MNAGRAVRPWNRLFENVPLVLLLDLLLELANKRSSAIAVSHDDGTVAFHAVRNHVALEPPVAAAMHEVPAFSPLLDLESDATRPNPDRRHHFLDHGPRKNTVGLSEKRLLDLNDKPPEIRRRRP